MSVNIGEVETFSRGWLEANDYAWNGEPTQNAVKKIAEECSEVAMAFGQYMYSDGYKADIAKQDLVDECADVIQATCNLLAALGVEDMRPAMGLCRRRNEDRGRM